jgi:predicted tellurium resistance membrane protein TerC
MKNLHILAVFFLGLWAWAVFVNLREHRWLDAGGWAFVGVIGAAIFAGEADHWPMWMKLLLVAVFVSVSSVLSWRQMQRQRHGH